MVLPGLWGTLLLWWNLATLASCFHALVAGPSGKEDVDDVSPWDNVSMAAPRSCQGRRVVTCPIFTFTGVLTHSLVMFLGRGLHFM